MADGGEAPTVLVTALGTVGEAGLARLEAAGDDDLAGLPGEAGRDGLANPETEGLAGRGIVPIRVFEAGEAGRGIPAARRAT